METVIHFFRIDNLFKKINLSKQNELLIATFKNTDHPQHFNSRRQHFSKLKTAFNLDINHLNINIRLVGPHWESCGNHLSHREIRISCCNLNRVTFTQTKDCKHIFLEEEDKLMPLHRNKLHTWYRICYLSLIKEGKCLRGNHRE